MAKSRTTIDHGEIQRWVEKRGGCPARVRSTAKRGRGGVLRIDYTGFSGKDSLEEIPWDDWFETFDESNLAFVYQTGDSRFSKLVDRDSVDVTPKKRASGGERKSATTKKATAKKATAKKATAQKASTRATTKRATAKRAGAAAKKPAARTPRRGESVRGAASGSRPRRGESTSRSRSSSARA